MERPEAETLRCTPKMEPRAARIWTRYTSWREVDGREPGGGRDHLRARSSNMICAANTGAVPRVPRLMAARSA